jgi:hypothetical protein
MKKITAFVIMAMLILAFVPRLELTAQEGRGRGEMDEERIKKIAEKHGITVEEVRERMAGARGGQGGQQQAPADNTVAMATTDKYLFVVKGNYVYQFDINTMQRKNKVALDEDIENKKNYIHDALKQRVATTKVRIEELREQGKNDEADKMEKQLKDFIERARKMNRKAGKGDRGGEMKKPEAEGNPQGDVLF